MLKNLSYINFILIIILFFALFYNFKLISTNKVTETKPADNITYVNYSCDSGKTISAIYMGADKVELNLSDKRSFLLLQGMSGSGVRYTNSNETTTFWNSGNTAFLEEGNATTFNNCIQKS